MNASASEAHAAAARRLYGRAPDEIICDLNACSDILTRELARWSETTPNRAALTTAETTVDGLRRLLGQLRLVQQRPGAA